MSYNLTPMTEEELNAYDLIEEGIYDFEVLRSDRQTSKSGNAMAKVQLNVWDKDGKSVVVFDYLVFSNIKLCVRKIKHFCEAAGIADDYQKGNIREEFQGLCGKVHIGIQERQQKPNSDEYYPAKNVVIDYINKDNASQSVIQQNVKPDEFNDQISF